MRWMLPLTMLLGCLVAPARADDLSSLLDDHSYAVLRVDLQQIDTAALGQWVIERARVGMDVPQARQRAIDVGAGAARVGTVVTLLRGQGVQRVYLVFDARLVGMEWPMFLAIPCAEQTGRRLAIQAGLMQLGTRVGQGWMIAGKLDGLAALADFRPAPRADLQQLLNAQRGMIAGAIQPMPAAREALEAMLPPMDDVTNGEVGAIIGAFESMSLTLAPPPGFNIALQLSVSDAVSADNYERLFRNLLSNTPPERQPAVELLLPQREGTTFKLSIDEARFDTLLKALQP